MEQEEYDREKHLKFPESNWGNFYKKEKDNFISFFECLKNNVKIEKHINWDKNIDTTKYILNFLKQSKSNWNDVLMIGHLLIEISFYNSILSLTSNDNNTTIIKNCIKNLKEQNNKTSFINRDMMLMISSYHGKPLNNIEVDICESSMISINLKKRFDILTRNEFKCVYCGKSPPEVKLELEHIKPLSKGGSNCNDNLTTACFECNSGKRARILTEIIKESINEEK